LLFARPDSHSRYALRSFYSWNTFLYYPKSLVYTLSRFDSDGRLEIYALQSFGGY